LVHPAARVATSEVDMLVDEAMGMTGWAMEERS
jgi:hypothetical protein